MTVEKPNSDTWPYSLESLHAIEVAFRESYFKCLTQS